MAKELYTVNINGTDTQQPLNTPVTLPIGPDGTDVRCSLHELTVPKTKPAVLAGYVPVREFAATTWEDFIVELDDWHSKGYVSLAQVLKYLSHAMTLSGQSRGRGRFGKKTDGPSEDEIAFQMDTLDFSIYQGRYAAMRAEAVRLATLARVTAPTISQEGSNKVFTELL